MMKVFIVRFVSVELFFKVFSNKLSKEWPKKLTKKTARTETFQSLFGPVVGFVRASTQQRFQKIGQRKRPEQRLSISVRAVSLFNSGSNMEEQIIGT